MTGHRRLLQLAVDNRYAVYFGALIVILFTRTSPGFGSDVQRIATAVVLLVMVATYGGERWLSANADARRPGYMLLGLLGVAGGSFAVLTGVLGLGLVIAAGGLLFVHFAAPTAGGDAR